MMAAFMELSATAESTVRDDISNKENANFAVFSV